MNRKETIVASLERFGPLSAYRLAEICHCPPPSVHRTIQELRRESFNISFSDGFGEQLYRIGKRLK